MMNIESNRFRIQSDATGRTVTDKSTGETEVVSQSPNAQTLAAMTERQFDAEMLKLLGRWIK